MADAQVSQVATEVLQTGAAQQRASQVAVEVLATGTAQQRVSQIVIEVLVPNVLANPARSWAIWID